MRRAFWYHSPEASCNGSTDAGHAEPIGDDFTGAKFEVTAGDGSRGIVLGTLADFPNPALNDVLAIRNNHDGKESFAIRTEAQRLLLIGAT